MLAFEAPMQPKGLPLQLMPRSEVLFFPKVRLEFMEVGAGGGGLIGEFGIENGRLPGHIDRPLRLGFIATGLADDLARRRRVGRRIEGWRMGNMAAVMTPRVLCSSCFFLFLRWCRDDRREEGVVLEEILHPDKIRRENARKRHERRNRSD